MKRIDFYVQHLTKHNANGIELVSGRPVKFLLPTGPRMSNKPIEHGQIAQLVQEAAPGNALDALRATGQSQFHYRSEDGTDVVVNLSAPAPGTWTVRIIPAAEAPPARPSLPAASAPGGFGGQRGMGSPPVGAMGGMGAPLGGASMGARAPAPAAAPPPKEPEPAAEPDHKAQHGKPIPDIQIGPDEPKINYWLRLMKKLGASDLHLSAGVVPMARIDGSVVEVKPGTPPLDPDELEEVLLEIAPETNREEFAATNDTDFAHEIPGVCRFRANVFRDLKGPGGVFRQIPFEILTVDQIGVPTKVLDLCYLTKGLVLVTGPTGSGKSTTLATLIDYINQTRDDHIITIEDPVEFVHPNKKCLVNQREVGTHTGSFKRALRAALREDPDIVLVGEMRDLETISIAVETAETGHLVFGTLHTTSAPSTVDRIIDQFPPDQQEQIRVMLSESLKGVIAQVLCKKIGGGRVAGYEVLIGTSAVANLIREGKTFQLKSTMQTGRRLGMQTMNDHLLEHVKNGKVSPEEAYMKSNDKPLFKEALQREGIKLSIANDDEL